MPCQLVAARELGGGRRERVVYMAHLSQTPEKADPAGVQWRPPKCLWGHGRGEKRWDRPASGPPFLPG